MRLPCSKPSFVRNLLLPIFSLCLIALVSACTGDYAQQTSATRIERRQDVEGDVNQGRHLLAAYGCGACHTIPGIAGANALVGPPLNDWSQRSYIAGSLANTPENLLYWIMDPQAVEPGTAMPDLNVSQEAAQHMSAYLYGLGS